MAEDKKPWITVGIPCYQNAPAETLEDYMRFAYHLGRRMPEYEFALAVKPKSEQFRARNSILQAAVQMNSRYCLMLDDDQVIGWDAGHFPSEQYNFLAKLIGHMEKDPKLGIVGALYFHKGDECLPVVMKQGVDGGYYYMRDDELHGGLQEVAVTGGGCILVNMKALDFVPQPWFAPEFKYGTDIQICQKMREQGFKVAVDLDVTLGHVSTKRLVVTAANRSALQLERYAGERNEEQVDPRWLTGSSYNLYYLDGKEYLNTESDNKIVEMFTAYEDYIDKFFPENLADLELYYRGSGPLQVARQLLYHASEAGRNYDAMLLGAFKSGLRLYGLDYGCGSSYVGFELAMRGNRMDFIDLDGAGGYEFLKWRIKKRSLEARCGFSLKGPYDFIMLNDFLEHVPDPAQYIIKLVPYLKEGAPIFTNFFVLIGQNPEHISQGKKEAVKQIMLACGIYPLNPFCWIKKDLGFRDQPQEEVNNGEASNSEQNNLLRQQQEPLPSV
jgi:hypothetical protein